MIRLESLELSATVMLRLDAWQGYVDAGKDYLTQVARAKSQFKSANTSSNQTFREIRATLTTMCSGARRCMYCEDPVADEIEHHKPKDLYPSEAFSWDIYLYACGPCNGPKNSRFSIVGDSGLMDITRRRGGEVVAPPDGASSLIHPRFEDPMYFLLLDIIGDTFRFTPHPLTDELDKQRAEYTIDVLGLNKKDYLLAARREAYHSYFAEIAAICPH